MAETAQEKIVKVRAWQRANPDRVDAARAKWEQNNKGHYKRLQWKSVLKRQYSLTLEQFDEMVLGQCGRCAICHEPMAVAVVDHDHETGKVRGLLCGHCNLALGHLRDSAPLCEAAAAYLRGSNG